MCLDCFCPIKFAQFKLIIWCYPLLNSLTQTASETYCNFESSFIYLLYTFWKKAILVFSATEMEIKELKDKPFHKWGLFLNGQSFNDSPLVLYVWWWSISTVFWNKFIQPRLYILFDELIIYFFVCVKSE